MQDNPTYLKNEKASFQGEEKDPVGKLVVFEDENYYKISNCDAMRPFFMSLISDSNHWMFISSNGGLSAGRKNAEYALFPYYSDDKITEAAEITGSKTIFRVDAQDRSHLWEPFSNRYSGLYKINRNLYKSSYGNKIVFEEINEDLGLVFRYQWNTSDRFGFVKKASLLNTTTDKKRIRLLDGLQNILPYGVSSDLQNRQSNLVDAYKKNELENETAMGIYALSAIIVDRAEPSEALKANTVWSAGLENATYLVSSLQLDAFRRGKAIEQEIDIRAEKGAYFICTDLELPSQMEKDWIIVADVDQSIADIAELTEKIKTENDLMKIVREDIESGSKRLLELCGATDGLQLTADKLRNTRHFSNSMFNIMRGGIFDDNYQLERWDFMTYIEKANKNVFRQKKGVLEALPDSFPLDHLKTLVEKDEDPDFKRLAFEYLPLKFSRRHGDPSRPWNRFSINTTAEDGSKILDYEGNWRDIFQNWEALAHSYPEFIESMIHKFLNATTFDGYNPYRVTKDGFDWEVIEEDDPWSYIGYWGDHQIIYLLKFLEFIETHDPGRLGNCFDERIFVYANVPYQIKDYESILANPKDTIVFDGQLDSAIRKERDKIGADGAFLKEASGSIYKVNLLEKLLATLLAKISNFIPEGGIWMNTQRPEWNDANNALVGNGVSMVTLYYLRRFLGFFQKVVEEIDEQDHMLSKELLVFFDALKSTLAENRNVLSGSLSDKDRKRIMDGLGRPASTYRNTIYENGFSGQTAVLPKKGLLEFIKTTLTYLDHSIEANQRDDKLYHSYNLMTVENNREVSLSHLSEMLEGQVATLSSGHLSSSASLALLDGLKNSALFRHDQYSYLLYPNKQLPRFAHKNKIPADRIEQSELVARLLEDGNPAIVEKDILGCYHFNGSFNNANSLKAALSGLSEERYGTLVKKEEPLLLSIFEEVFDHKSFTGRSGTFFGYEGLGSIYWHMVSKLLLAVQETCLRAIDEEAGDETVGRLLEHYYEINEGIGIHKPPKLYGAFPTDPYSHTPMGKGAQQPGMTGQVKEDILCRFGELGVFVEKGQLVFRPSLLRKDEFLKKPASFEYVTVNGRHEKLPLDKDTLCFTYCQIPIIYQLSENQSVKVVLNNGSDIDYEGWRLNNEISKKVFRRTGEIDRIIIEVKK